jgi:uncharacterized protein (TIGR03437 family)
MFFRKNYNSGSALLLSALLLAVVGIEGAEAKAQCTYIGEARTTINDDRGLNLILDSGGYTAALSLTTATQAGCDTTLSGVPDWISFGAGQSTTETVTINGTTIVNAKKVVYGQGTILENKTGGPRSATIKVGGLTFTITQAKEIALVSAANYQRAVAAGSIAAVYGAGMSTTTATASSVPLPSTLSGASVQFKGLSGPAILAPLFFVSPQQINVLIPQEATGLYRIAILNGETPVAVHNDQLIAAVAPSLFTLNHIGTGVPAGVVLRYINDQAGPSETIYQLDSQNRFAPRPIDLGPESDRVFLSLFGTGFRLRSGLPGVSVKIGGIDAVINYAGPQGALEGLDQLNVLIPRSLIGRGEVDLTLTVDGQPSNTVRVNIK